MFNAPLNKVFAPDDLAEQFEEAMLHDLIAQTHNASGRKLYGNALDWMKKWLKADICFIGELQGGDNIIRAIRGGNRHPIRVGSRYVMAGTPCELAVRKGGHFQPERVAEHHPADPLLRTLNIEGYAGVPLQDKNGQLLGTIVALTRGELVLPRNAKSLMKVLAARVASDMAHVQEETTPNTSEYFSHSVLDAIPANICILDSNADIVFVNRRWRQFEENIQDDREPRDVGANYLKACVTTQSQGVEDACIIRDGIERLLGGRHDSFSHEYTSPSPYQNRWFVLVAKRFGQGKCSYILLIHFDVTDRKQAESHLSSRSAILDAMISCDGLLHSTDSWHKVIPDVLGMIGSASSFCRVYLFRHNGGRVLHATSLYHWAAPGLDPKLSAYRNIDYMADGCERWRDMLGRGQPVFGDMKDFLPQEQKYLKRHGTRTLILIPIFTGEKWWGFLALERCDESRELSPQELSALMAAGRSFGVAIQREASNERLNQARIAFESASEGIMITDDQARIIAINDGFSEITGYREEEILGHTPKVLRSEKHSREFYDEIRRAITQEGRWRGEIWSKRKDGDIYPEWLTITAVKDAEGSIVNYVGVFADITEVKLAKDRLHELVNHDPLTGLPNRRLLNELMGHAIKRAEREKNMIALLFIDLDRFKVINDTLGHHVGDKLLYEVSCRLASAVRESDAVGRLGGDEFVVMMDCLRDIEDATVVANKILREALNKSFLRTPFFVQP